MWELKHFIFCTSPQLDKVCPNFHWSYLMFKNRKYPKIVYFLELLCIHIEDTVKHYDGVFLTVFLLSFSAFFYDSDVCHRDGFTTCFPRVSRPQLINNMTLFSANGTNSSILRRGLKVHTIIALSEPVPVFSTRLSNFSVSTLFLLHCKIRFSSKRASHECEQIVPHLLEEKGSFIICAANSCF